MDLLDKEVGRRVVQSRPALLTDYLPANLLRGYGEIGVCNLEPLSLECFVALPLLPLRLVVTIFGLRIGFFDLLVERGIRLRLLL
ncbi:MAG: hypothetical protein AUK47_27960 [Deltaproteobacteria bacterium CG2_30_63_29]|nr:MAG: hypothetical protein AUK47_27960 [Deltaproteobacteria bacterium CG2_30_63_29]PIW02123.1 MAG: hypothetical protein COW42_02685 [Deltaproteobacteria bacterium CG17_big_fil_post_rev_8_21_14_2_50_63_7]PJB35123.1 MAG: hypothetical protein CO108_26355 [Deltaproteobacteria bacterium CG_4_9_14_3_um_filter_63_12]